MSLLLALQTAGGVAGDATAALGGLASATVAEESHAGTVAATTGGLSSASVALESLTGTAAATTAGLASSAAGALSLTATATAAAGGLATATVAEESLTATAAATVAGLAAAAAASQPNPPISALVETFAAGALDPQWVAYAGGSYAGAVSGGAYTVTPPAGAAPGPFDFAGLYSARAYDLTGAGASVEVAERFATLAGADGSLTAFAVLTVVDAARAYNQWAELSIRERVDGASILYADTQDGPVWQEPFDPAAHRWLRIRHDAGDGLLHYEAAPDGVAWTEVATASPGALDVGAVVVDLYGSASTGLIATGVLRFDNVNVAPVAGAAAATTGGLASATAAEASVSGDAAATTAGLAASADAVVVDGVTGAADATLGGLAAATAADLEVSGAAEATLAGLGALAYESAPVVVVPPSAPAGGRMVLRVDERTLRRLRGEPDDDDATDAAPAPTRERAADLGAVVGVPPVAALPPVGDPAADALDAAALAGLGAALAPAAAEDEPPPIPPARVDVGALLDALSEARALDRARALRAASVAGTAGETLNGADDAMLDTAQVAAYEAAVSTAERAEAVASSALAAAEAARAAVERQLADAVARYERQLEAELALARRRHDEELAAVTLGLVEAGW